MPLAEQAYTHNRITPPFPKKPQLTWLPRKSGNKGIRVEKVVCDVNPLIQIESKPIQATLHILLQDKTTKKNIIWATNSYESYGSYYYGENQITEELISGLNQHIIQPRVYKSAEAQAARTQKHAEVFTPTWICNQMNNFCDEEWFGRKDVFNCQEGKSWTAATGKIEFPAKKSWKRYVDSRRLEITCGEAPFLVSRYDASTGETIPIERRIGILDRKIRVIGENAESDTEWRKWCIRAFQSVYGYEYQGDNLLIGRINLLMTFVDYYVDRFHKEPTNAELRKIANIISWNLWQMDGLTGTVPYGVPEDNVEQLSMYGNEEVTGQTNCRIFDWRASRSLEYNELKGAGQE